MDPASWQHEIAARIEVLADLEPDVDELMRDHESKRELWWPSDLMEDPEEDNSLDGLAKLREMARGLTDPCRIALALNLITEEGLPHFHRLLAVHFGDETFWRRWMNLWTAEEDRHGAVLRDYCRDAKVMHSPTFDRLQFSYLRSGFHPSWDRDPYRVFVYTTLQERATQTSHMNTGTLCGQYEPRIGYILSRIGGDEARHYAFYRNVFAKVLVRDPDRALDSAAHVMPSIEMPGASMPGFRDFADVVRRAGIYGPRDYLKIVQDQIKFWQIETMTGLKEQGRKAQEKILGIPSRLEKVAEYIESRSGAKTFSFDLIFQRTFAME